MRFGHFHEVRENPERSFFDQNGNFLHKESVHTPTENLKTGADILKKAGTFTPDPEAKAAIENASSLLEAGEIARKMLEEKKAKMASKSEINQMTDEAMKKIEVSEPDFSLPEDLRKEGIHV